MSEPAKGVWKVLESPQPADEPYVRHAVLPAAAQVVEMPVAPGDPPCVYVRGQRARWRVLWHSPYWDSPVTVDAEDEVDARRIYAQWLEKRKGFERVELTCEVVVETRTKEDHDRPAG